MGSAKLRELPGGGLLLEVGGIRYALDPRIPVKADYTFVSHAHNDHLPVALWEHTRVIATRETAELARLRGLKLDRVLSEPRDAELVPTGHMLGAAGLLVGGVLYTGDIAGRPRAFLGAAKPVKAETLIIESTYGRPSYVFPPMDRIVDSVKRLLASAYNAGKPVFLLGYPLGKSQVLAYLTRSWGPLVTCKKVEEGNEAYRRLGVDLPEAAAVLDKPARLSEIKKPAVVLVPTTMATRALREAFNSGAVTAWFSGWALYARRKEAVGIPLSDHADYNELVDYVKKVNPREVVTFHGFAKDLALSLRRLGFDARPVSREPRTIQEYFARA